MKTIFPCFNQNWMVTVGVKPKSVTVSSDVDKWDDCGIIYKELKLSERKWACTECGAVHDRDMNAALNLRDYPFLNENCTVSSTGINAFGENVRLSNFVLKQSR